MNTIQTSQNQTTQLAQIGQAGGIRRGMAWLVLVILTSILVGCSTVEETPTPMPTSTPTPVEEAIPQESEMTPTPEAEAAGATATPAPSNGTAVLSPLVVDDSTADCPIESNLDLAGYRDIEERMGCALAPAKFDPVAINEFGEGPDYNRFMLWFGAEGNIYVLLPEGEYVVYVDEWQEGDPTFACNPLDGEPDSPPLPRRGFGKVWCEQPDLQEIMGLVEREERLCQHAVDQPFEQGRLVACFEDASVRYFRILSDGTWDVTLQ